MPLRAPRDEFEARVFDLHSKGRSRDLYEYLFSSSMWIPMPISATGSPEPGGGGSQFTDWEAAQLKDWIGVDGHYLDNGYAKNINLDSDVDLHDGGAGILALGTDGGGERGIYLYSGTAGRYCKLRARGNQVTFVSMGADNPLQFVAQSSYLTFTAGPSQLISFLLGSFLSVQDADAAGATRLSINSANGDIVPGTDGGPQIGDSTHDFLNEYIRNILSLESITYQAAITSIVAASADGSDNQ